MTNEPLAFANAVLGGAKPVLSTGAIRERAIGWSAETSSPLALQVVSARQTTTRRRIFFLLLRPSPRMRRLSLLLLSVIASLFSSPALAGTEMGKAPSAASVPDIDTTDRFIVKLRDPSADPRAALAAIGGTFGERLEHVRRMS